MLRKVSALDEENRTLTITQTQN